MLKRIARWMTGGLAGASEEGGVRRPRGFMGTCQGCRWWGGGYCKRYPPALIYREDVEQSGRFRGDARTLYPTTAAKDWCGEWEQD